jgi:hypothetical protein
MENTVEKKDKKVEVRIPKGQFDKGMNFVPVCINGKITKIKRGEKVMVSQQVANILEEAGYLDS